MMRLGRLPHSPAAVSAAPSLAAHRFAAVEPRPILDRRYIDYQPLMCGNQTKPVCTIAGLVNGMLAAEAVNNRASLPIDQGTVDPFYASIAGCAPTSEAVQRAIASAVASRSALMSWSTISASASSGKVRMSPSRLRVNSTLPAPMNAILVMPSPSFRPGRRPAAPIQSYPTARLEGSVMAVPER